MSGSKNDNPVPKPPTSDGVPLQFPWRAWLPWMAAAAFALLAGILGRALIAARSELSVTQTERALADIEVRSLRQRSEAERIIARRRLADGVSERGLSDDLSRLAVASLIPADRNRFSGHAVAVWDPVRQRGELAVFGLPASQPGTTYVAWIIESGRSAPVRGGVFTIGQSSAATRVRLKPAVPVPGDVRFAVSVAAAEAVPAPPASYVLASE